MEKTRHTQGPNTGKLSPATGLSPCVFINCASFPPPFLPSFLPISLKFGKAKKNG